MLRDDDLHFQASLSGLYLERQKNYFQFPMTLNLSFCCHIWKVHTQLSQLLNKAQCSESCKNWSVFFYTLHSLCLAQHHKCTKGCFKIFSSNLVFWAHMMNISFFTFSLFLVLSVYSQIQLFLGIDFCIYFYNLPWID